MSTTAVISIITPGVNTARITTRGFNRTTAKSVAGMVLTLFLLFTFALPGFAAPVDVNTADANALSEALSGVGPKIAEEIILYRKENGPFMETDDLLNVKGIGPGILDRNKADILIGETTSGSTAD